MHPDFNPSDANQNNLALLHLNKPSKHKAVAMADGAARERFGCGLASSSYACRRHVNMPALQPLVNAPGNFDADGPHADGSHDPQIQACSIICLPAQLHRGASSRLRKPERRRLLPAAACRRPYAAAAAGVRGPADSVRPLVGYRPQRQRALPAGVHRRVRWQEAACRHGQACGAPGNHRGLHLLGLNRPQHGQQAVKLLAHASYRQSRSACPPAAIAGLSHAFRACASGNVGGPLLLPRAAPGGGPLQLGLLTAGFSCSTDRAVASASSPALYTWLPRYADWLGNKVRAAAEEGTGSD